MLGGERSNVPTGVEFHQVDCNDLDRVRGLLRDIDLVYHCAAAPHEGLSVFSPCVITTHTYNSTVSVAAAACSAGVRRFVFTSSMARYGRQPVLPFTEDMTPLPRDPYGVAKWAAEEALRCLCEAHDMEYVVAVPHNIIGPRQKYDDPFRNVASIMINRMLQGHQPYIYGDGTQARSFTFVADCVNPLAEMAFRPGLSGQVINVGPDEESTTVNELAERIARIIGFDLNPIYVPDRPMEVKRAYLSADKARKLLGYRTTTDLDKGLRHMVAWIRENGPRPFVYHLPIEIESDKLPVTWRDRLF
jgi:UDP-glucose 4-epimerase